MATITLEGNQLKIVNGTIIRYIPANDFTIEIIAGKLFITQKQLVRYSTTNRADITNIASTSLENLADLISALVATGSQSIAFGDAIIFWASGNTGDDQDGNTKLEKMANGQVGVFHNTGGVWDANPVETFDNPI